MALNRSTVKCIVTPLHPPAKGLGKRKDKAVQASDVKVFQILIFSLWTRGLVFACCDKACSFHREGVSNLVLQKMRVQMRVWKWLWGNVSFSHSLFTGAKQILLLVLDVP